MKRETKKRIVIYTIMTFLIIGLDWNVLLMVLLPFFIYSTYKTTDLYLNKVRTRITNTTFEISRLVVKSDINITNERQKIVKKIC